MIKIISRVFILAIAVSSMAACATSSIFPVLTDQIAGISAMAFDVDANRLYVVNANEKVAYDWTQGSFQVYDITDPLNPVLMRTTETLSFSGKVSLDLNRKLAYVTNRYSETDTTLNDRLYIFNIDESSPDFMTYTELSVGRDPFGIVCCYPNDRLWIAQGGLNDTYNVQYVDKGNLLGDTVNMLVGLSNGGEFVNNATTDLAIVGQMGFFSRNNGGVVVVNLAEAGVEGAEPVDYWIEDIRTPRGITTDGTYVYVVSEEDETGSWVPQVHVLNPAPLAPLTDNAVAQVLDKNDDGLLVASIPLNDRRDPQEILLTNDFILVTVGWNNNNFVEVIRRADLAWITEIATGDEPFAMALYAPGGVEKYVYVANQIDNTIQMIDIATLTIVGTYPQ